MNQHEKQRVPPIEHILQKPHRRTRAEMQRRTLEHTSYHHGFAGTMGALMAMAFTWKNLDFAWAVKWKGGNASMISGMEKFGDYLINVEREMSYNDYIRSISIGRFDRPDESTYNPRGGKTVSILLETREDPTVGSRKGSETNEKIQLGNVVLPWRSDPSMDYIDQMVEFIIRAVWWSDKSQKTRGMTPEDFVWQRNQRTLTPPDGKPDAPFEEHEFRQSNCVAGYDQFFMELRDEILTDRPWRIRLDPGRLIMNRLQVSYHTPSQPIRNKSA